MSRTLIAGITNRVLMSVAAGLLVLSFLSAFVNPAKVWYLTLFGLMFLPLLFINLFLLVWAVFRRSGAFVIPLAALLPTLFFVGRYFQTGDAGDGTYEDGDVKIISYNVGRFASARGGKRLSLAECQDSVCMFLKSENADIICLQEVYSRSRQALESLLSRHFGDYESDYYIYTGKYGCFGNVILSKFPVLDKGVVKFDRSTNLAVYSDLSVRGERVRVYNCHFESYNISFPGIVKALREKNDEIFRETERKMRHSLSLRPRQVDKVIRHISDCATSTVLCGDFNDNPLSYTYQQLIRSHKDAFREAGSGLGSTYAAVFPVLRIDYVLVPEDYEVKSYAAPEIDFSDHYPVISGFSAK